MRKPFSLFGILVMYGVTALLPQGDSGSLQLLIAIAAFGLLLTSIQTFGWQIATERKQGWLESLRTTPLPAWVYLTSKVLVALLLSALGIGITFGIGAFYLSIQQTPTEWATIAGCLMLGVIPMAMAGFAIAHLFDAAVVPLVSLPILGAAMITSNSLDWPAMPHWLQNAILFSPFYHYAQLVMWAGHLTEPSFYLQTLFIFKHCILNG